MHALPSWLTDEFPQPNPISTIFKKGGDIYVVSSDNTLSTVHNSVKAAYDSIDTSRDIIFDESVNGCGGELSDQWFFFGENESFNTRILLGSTHKDRISYLQTAYNYWIDDINAQYKMTPNDWLSAYLWINYHPMFWTKYEDKKTLRWATDTGVDSARVSVYRNNKGNPIIDVEHGSHTEDYLNHYVDNRFDTYAGNFEEAYVELARKINLHYNIDGTDKSSLVQEKLF